VDARKGHGLALLIAVAIVVLIAQVLLVFAETRQLIDAEAEQEKISQRILQLRGIWEQMQNAETGQRTFLFTGDDSYLATYSRALSEIESHLINARRLYTDDPSVLSRLSTLETLRQRKIAELADGIRLHASVGQHAALVLIRSGVGRRYMNEMQAILNAELGAAHARHTTVNKQIADKIHFLRYLLAALSATGVTIIGYVFIQLRRAFKVNAELTDLLNEQATHDVLTGLPNRRMLVQWLETTRAQAARAKTRIAVFFLDLDGFKPVNDRLGHETGDTVLQAAVARFQKTLRSGDILARVGGDEFVIVLTNNPLKSDLRVVAQRLIDGMNEPLIDELPANALGVSVGIAMYPEHGTETDTLLAAADEAMYRAKQAGRRQFQFAVSHAVAAVKSVPDSA
jgi:diguanylate cyclase